MLWPTINPTAANGLQCIKTSARHASSPACRSCIRIRRTTTTATFYAEHGGIAHPGTHLASWEPQIIYVHHQSGPFTRIWLPPFSEPVGIDAFIMSREVNMIGILSRKVRKALASRRDAHGNSFTRTPATDYAPNFKNIAAF